MARDQVAKLFLLAASTESEPEAMSALRQMRRVLQDDGLDVHAIATAINLHLGVTKMPTLDSLLDDMKANIDKGFAAAREAYDTLIAVEFRKELAKHGLDPRPTEPWVEVKGSDPWLADDDPIWAAREAREQVKARAQQEAERKKKEADDRQREEHARRRKEAERTRPERVARAAEAILKKARDAAKEAVKQEIEARKLDAVYEAAFEQALWCFRNRAIVTKTDRQFIERIFRKSRRVAQPSELPLRTFYRLTTEIDRLCVADLFARYHGMAVKAAE